MIDLEARISEANDKFQAHYLAGDRDQARKWAEVMADLIAQRTPEQVAEMEREMGLG